MNCSKLWLCTIALGLLTPALAWAESPDVGLAPPGPCAEPRDRALRADPVYNTAAAEDETGPVFSIAGSPRDHFDPIDVAGGPVPSPVFSPPDPPELMRTPCSSPDPGCGDLLGGLTESVVQGGGPPGSQ